MAGVLQRVPADESEELVLFRLAEEFVCKVLVSERVYRNAVNTNLAHVRQQTNPDKPDASKWW